MKSARIISLVLAVIMALSVFVSCVENTETPDDTTEATTVAEDQTTEEPVITTVVTENKVSSSNPEFFYNNATVSILSRSNSWVSDEIWVDGFKGDLINDAVYTRNLRVEKRMDLHIENFMVDGDQYAVSKKIKALRETNDKSYDFFANSVYSTIMYTAEGNYADLYNCKYIEFDKPWYSQNFIDVASAGPSLYMITGSLAISMYRFLFVTFFNETLVNNVLDKGTDLYDVVNNGQFTIDYQINLAEKIYQGDGNGDENDVYGFVSNYNMIGVDPYLSSCELKILGKTSDNWYEYVLDVDHYSDVVDKLLNLFWGCKGTYGYSHESGDGEQAKIRKKFADGSAGMATLRLIEAESSELRNHNSFTYGIVPIPKYSKKQKLYLSYVHDMMTAFGIFSWLNDDQLQRAGALLNQMSLHSYREVQPTYYEIVLKSRYMDNEKSWSMLDMIVRNLYLDGGVLYTKKLNSVHQELRSIIASKTNKSASILASRESANKRALDELVKSIQAIQ